MDILIIMISLAFLSLTGFAVFSFLKEPAGKKEVIQEDKNEGPDLIAVLHKRIASYEEKIKDLEYRYEAIKLELTQDKEIKKELIKEKSSISFDAQEYEKFKKEYKTLKDELASKEEILEKEISLRRQQSSELAQFKSESDTLKKKALESEDAHRRAQTLIEALTKELNSAKKIIEDQKKIVLEHTEDKSAGEWVSRIEFNKLQSELKEKEALVKKMGSLHNGENPAQKEHQA